MFSFDASQSRSNSLLKFSSHSNFNGVAISVASTLCVSALAIGIIALLVGIPLWAIGYSISHASYVSFGTILTYSGLGICFLTITVACITILAFQRKF